MVSFYQLKVVLLDLLVRKSQANLLGDAHLLKRYTQAYELPSAATHLTSRTLPGNTTSIGTSLHILLPTPTRQLVDESTLHSLDSFESTGIDPNTGTEGSIDHATSEALSLSPGSIPAPPLGGGTSATSSGIDWTALLPDTPTTQELLFSKTHPLTGQDPTAIEPSMGATPGVNTSFHARSTTATLPAIDTAIQQISTTSPNPSVVSPETSEISRSQELGTAIDTDNPPSETSLLTTLYEGPTGTYDPTSTAVQTQDEPGSTIPSTEALTADGSFSDPREFSAGNGIQHSEFRKPNEQPTRTSTVPSSEVALANSIVTGTDGTVATYVPEQNKDYISFTGTTTTTDDNGAAIVIFPFGWFWKLYGVPGGGDAAKPPAPTAKPVPEKEPGDKNEDDNDTGDDGASTKEDEKSTMVSTILSTTQGPTSASTTTRVFQNTN
ncbi:uncharacterized protein FMAN_11753 [Fusarium mangiferae]|uniref:Uncharacterized protein n=1 Tax=Fusarium mangiferae TaxID=192010 RepID=A0A1L7UNA3_FUSMA|nr:uncharacterized protein FMAN_11753 [Fusarium mangiferae]CVL08971.1 uncharacterized protein FMAN_11753 [Fusarium mangiferae]